VPLVIEDGSNVANANSYATRAEIIAYAAARGVTIADEDATDVFAVKAMDYIERQRFQGEPTYGVPGVDQALQFPRDGIAYQGGYFDADAIPFLLKNAECEAAMLIASGVDLEPNRAAEQSVKREKVGPLETEYFSPANYGATTPNLDALLAPLVVGSGFGITAYRV
jgi:hypothetical protein